jgi:hypothetical protein
VLDRAADATVVVETLTGHATDWASPRLLRANTPTARHFERAAAAAPGLHGKV